MSDFRRLHSRSALEGGEAGAHDLVDEKQVAGDDGAGVDHLLLHPVVVQDPEVDRVDRLAGGRVHAHGDAGLGGLGEELHNHLLGIVAYLKEKTKLDRKFFSGFKKLEKRESVRTSVLGEDLGDD